MRESEKQRGGVAIISEAPVKVFTTKFIVGIFIIGISNSLLEYELYDKNCATIYTLVNERDDSVSSMELL